MHLTNEIERSNLAVRSRFRSNLAQSNNLRLCKLTHFMSFAGATISPTHHLCPVRSSYKCLVKGTERLRPPKRVCIHSAVTRLVVITLCTTSSLCPGAALFDKFNLRQEHITQW